MLHVAFGADSLELYLCGLCKQFRLRFLFEEEALLRFGGSYYHFVIAFRTYRPEDLEAGFSLGY